jgi:hypothetical protein
MSLSAIHEFSCRSEEKTVSTDLASLRTAIRDKNRNLLKTTGNSASRCAKGRSEVCAALKNLVYPRHFQVEHQLDSNADVQMIAQGNGVKFSQAIVTIHGRMAWRHEKLPEKEMAMLMTFDRTFIFVLDGNWSITNDCISLRQHRETAILMGQAPARIEKLAKKAGLTPEVMAQIAATSSSDLELLVAAGEVATIGDVFNECVAAAAQDAPLAIKIARLVAQTNLVPANAAGLLTQTAGDVAAAVAQAPSLAPNLFRS